MISSIDVAHRTAIRRKKLSKPATRLKGAGLLIGRTLDYGCGRGDDAAELGCASYDPHYQPVMPEGKFDTIMCNYVLNVIESPEAIMSVLADIRDRLNEHGVAYISVRANKKDLKGLTSIGTWQGLVKLGCAVYYSCADHIIYEMRKDCPGFTVEIETFPDSA